jgi:hypothetical protein
VVQTEHRHKKGISKNLKGVALLMPKSAYQSYSTPYVCDKFIAG